jgi:hypothetical protein
MLRTSVTVIAPLHNAGQYLADFLPRIKATLRSGDQLILIDDGSTDDTAALITDWAQDEPGVLAIVNETNLGVAATRNRAVAAAIGDFVWFVDHDDAWELTILDTLTAASEDADAVICRAEYRIADGVSGRIVDGVTDRRRLTGDEAVELMLRGKVHGYLWTKLIKRATLGENPFPIQSSQSDFVGVTRTLGRSECVVTIPDVLYYYMHRDGSITRRRAPNLANYQQSRDAMISVVAASSTLTGQPELLSYFTAWFYCHAVAFVPVRSRAEPALIKDGVRLAQTGLRDISIRELLPFSKKVAAEMAGIRYAGSLYPATIRILLAVHDRTRALRSRARKRASA